MNTKNNSRRRETRRRIEDAFLQLLKDQELAHIKVVAICKAAKINRSTFYSNYTDVFDLAEQIRQRLVDEVNQLFLSEGNWEYSEADFLRLFRHIRDNQRLYLLYFKLNQDMRNDLKLYDTCKLPPCTHVDYHLDFFRNGFNAIVCRWLGGGCLESPEEMRNILLWEYQGRYIHGK